MAKPKKEEALVKKSSGALIPLSAAPAHLAKRTGPARGNEGMEQADLTIARLALAQSGSPQRKKANAKYIAGLEEGQFFNSVTKEIYGEEVLFVPIFWYKSRIKFNPFEDGGGIDCQAFNGKTGGKHAKACEDCPFSKFGEDGEAPECDLLYNYPSFVLANGKTELVVLSLKSTGIKVAKQFNSRRSLLVHPETGVPLDSFAGVYKIVSNDQSGKGNDYKGVDIELAGFTPEDVYKQAEAAYANLRGKKIEVDDQESQNTKKAAADSKDF